LRQAIARRLEVNTDSSNPPAVVDDKSYLEQQEVDKSAFLRLKNAMSNNPRIIVR
jgi:hypothetical protein